MSAEPRASRPRLSPRSLRVQMTVGSALIALGAVLFVTIAALLVSTLSFNEYRRGQLASYTDQVAQELGREGPAAVEKAQDDPRFLRQGQGGIGPVAMWVMTPGGHLVGALDVQGIPPQDAAQLRADQSAVLAALHAALAGATIQGDLAGGGPLFQNERFFVAEPIRAGGTVSGAIIGAVAIATPPRVDKAGLFASRLTTALPLAALVAALLAALLAAFFSRRLTRPVSRLTEASARMAGGDYTARVEVQAPDELHRLATSFNEMAAVLEADVSKLRAQERLRRELVANVSHELATPLTAIQGFTEALLEGVVHDPAGREQTTQLIAREAARLRRLVDQLRQVALYEGGAQTLHRAPVALPALVEETLAVLAPEFERKNIAVERNLPADLAAVYADSDRLTEILLNLLENALRHTPEGGRVAVEAASKGAFVWMSIADSGPGIPAADRDRVFERFFRVDSSRSAETGGTGLGLAIVRALVEAHGGTIGVENAPEGGARFTFTLPIADAAPSVYNRA